MGPILFDEDFFLNQEYARELGRLLRNDKTTRGVRFFTWSSIRSLSKFEPEELRDCGLGGVWIGVESFLCGENLTIDQYKKRGGEEVKEMFVNLHKQGIATIGSLVLGFDYHTPENLKNDIDQFIALKPTLYQLSPLLPCPGTALYDRMTEEGRVLDSYEWKDFNLWSGDVFKLKNFDPGEIREFFDYAHDKIRDELGPPAFQFLESMLDTHKKSKKNNLGDDTNEDDWNKRMANIDTSLIAVYVKAIGLNHSSEKVRARSKMLLKRYEDEIGNISLLSKGATQIISYLLKRKEKTTQPKKISDPPPRWSYYNTYDNRVWVKKGRKAKKPVPYKDRLIISRAKSIHNSLLPI